MEGSSTTGDGAPRLRVRVARSPGLRRWTDRRLVLAEVIAPSGRRYSVRIKRNWPIVRSPLGPLDGLAPTPVSLGALLAANAVSRGRTGWSVDVIGPPTAFRSEPVLHVRRSHDPQRIVDLTLTIVDAISAGHDPSDLDDDLSTPDRLKRLFNRE